MIVGSLNTDDRTGVPRSKGIYQILNTNTRVEVTSNKESGNPSVSDSPCRPSFHSLDHCTSELLSNLSLYYW